MAKKHQGTFIVRCEGEPPTAAFALWIDLTREQVAVLQPLGGENISIREYLRHIAIDAIEAKFPQLGKINRHTGPHDESEG
jgi:hypothetical protein